MPSKKSLVTIVFFAGVLLFMVCFSILVRKIPALIDEAGHFQTISEIQGGNIDNETFSRNAQLPGYYFLIAGVGFVTKLTSLFQLRMISLVFSFLSVIVFYLLAQKINRQQLLLKTAQYLFFPLYFVFFFLLYGDVLSFLILMLSFLYILDKKYFLAGALGLISIVFRQNNVVWLGFFCVYILAEEYKFKLRYQNIKSYLKDISLFILGFIGVIIFVVVNKGPAMAPLNPLVFRQENVFFMLAIYLFVFLPEIIHNLPKVFAGIKKNYYILLLLAAVFAYYLASFKIDHWFNDPVYFSYFIRNKMLGFASANPLQKTIFFIPIGFSILSLSATSFYKKTFYLLYPFIFLFLSLSWLVEQRYTMIPFVFLLLFKKKSTPLVEYSTLLLSILISAWLAWGVFHQRFFL